MDALRQTVFSFPGFIPVPYEILILALMGLVLLFASSKALKFLENKGRRTGTIAVRQR